MKFQVVSQLLFALGVLAYPLVIRAESPLTSNVDHLLFTKSLEIRLVAGELVIRKPLHNNEGLPGAAGFEYPIYFDRVFYAEFVTRLEADTVVSRVPLPLQYLPRFARVEEIVAPTPLVTSYSNGKCGFLYNKESEIMIAISTQHRE